MDRKIGEIPGQMIFKVLCSKIKKEENQLSV
jgi:hypothetical protein